MKMKKTAGILLLFLFVFTFSLVLNAVTYAEQHDPVTICCTEYCPNDPNQIMFHGSWVKEPGGGMYVCEPVETPNCYVIISPCDIVGP